MLTLRLKPGERLDIGENVSVHVYRWRGDSVELAIDAPREIPVTHTKNSENQIFELEQ